MFARPAITSHKAKPAPTGFTLPFKSLLAVGSMAAASTTLTLASNPGFAVDDYIIVELGGEAGTGLRGTIGVGGSWPGPYPSGDPAIPVHWQGYLYADLAAMNADVSKPQYTHAGVLSTGDVYIWDHWVPGAWAPNGAGYYTDKINPRALLARITAVADNVLTLDTPSTAATTNANVHYDNTRIWNERFEDDVDFVPDNNTVIIPAGRFAGSGNFIIHGTEDPAYPNLYQRKYWTFIGLGRDSSEIFAPLGARSVAIEAIFIDGMVFKDFAITGNMLNEKYGIGIGPSYFFYPSGLHITHSHSLTVSGIKITDVFQQGVWIEYGFGTNRIRDCHVNLTDAPMMYIQWFFGCNDTYGSTIFEDCSITSAWQSAGFEAFRSDGAQFKRITMHNCICSFNSSGGWLAEDINMTFDENCHRAASTGASLNNPLFNINSNIAQSSGEGSSMLLGGHIKGLNLNAPFAMNAAGQLNANAINISDSNTPNIVVTGDYPDGALPRRGYINLPTTGIAFADPRATCKALNQLETRGVVIRNMRLKGYVDTGWQGVVSGGYPAFNGYDTVVRDSVVDSIVGVNPINIINNMTNAAYDALNP